jgi:mono/diheme cytochrome c family protein
MGGSTGVGGGTQLIPPNSYVVLTGADAAPGSMPAPAAWASAGCNVCHQANGEGFNGLAPEVRHVPASYATWVVRHGRVFNGVQTGMLAFPTTTTDPMKMPAITDADLVAVIAWLEAMPKPTTGQGLYKDFCGNCHGPVNPSGGIVPVSILNHTRTVINQKVRVGEGMDPAVRTGFMPPEDMSKLSDIELGMIEDFLMATP